MGHVTENDGMKMCTKLFRIEGDGKGFEFVTETPGPLGLF